MNIACESQSLFKGYYIDATTIPNILRDTNKQVRISKLLDKDIEAIYNCFKKYNDGENIFVINANDMYISPGHEFFEMLSSDKVIIIGLAEKEANELVQNCSTENIDTHAIEFKTTNKNTLIYNDKLDRKILKKILGIDIMEHDVPLDGHIYNNVFSSIRTNVIGDYLYGRIERKTEYIPSSNIYANMYVNIQCIFESVAILNCLVQEIALIIKEKFRNYKSLNLLGVSVNGSILANLLSYNLKIPFVYINRLGPDYSPKEIDTINMSKYGKSFLLISDFICLGSEYKRAGMLFRNTDSKIKGCLAVAKIEDIHRDINFRGYDKEKNIYSLTGNINKLVRSFEYKIYYTKEDVENDFIRRKVDERRGII